MLKEEKNHFFFTLFLESPFVQAADTPTDFVKFSYLIRILHTQSPNSFIIIILNPNY